MALAFNSATKKWERTTTAPLPSSTPKAPVTARPTTGQTPTSLIGRQIPKNTGNNVNESQAMFGSGLANQTPSTSMPTQNSGVPKPTVATTQNPVVDMSKPKPVPSFNQYDTSAVAGLDMNGLQDFIDQTNIDIRRGTPLTPEREAQLYKAQRRIQELNTTQQISNPIEPQISAVEEQKRREAERLATQSRGLIDKRRADLEAQYGIRANELDAQGQKTMSAAQGVLSFSGFGRSTYAADKQAEIQQNVNQAKQSMQAEKDYAIAKYEAELAGADAETLAGYDEQIAQLRQQNTNFLIQSAQAMNEYNLQTSASYEEKINNIFKLAEANNVSDLTEQEKAQASAYGDLLLDAEGNLNTALIKDIPTRLVNEAIMQGAVKKASIKPKIEAPKTASDGAGNTYSFNETTGEREMFGQGKTERDPNTSKVVTITNSDGSKSVMQFNTNTGMYDIPVVPSGFTPNGTPVTQAIQTAIEKNKTGAQCGKFVNDILQNMGLPRLVGNSYASKEMAISQIGIATSYDDMGVGSIFSYPVKGSDYGHIGIVTGVNDDGTINIMDYNYKGNEQRRERSNVSPGEIIEKGGRISQPIIREDTVPSQEVEPDLNKFPQYVSYIENGKLPTGMKDGSPQADIFKSQALNGYLTKKEQELNGIGLTISNPSAFASVVTDAPKIKAINAALSKVPAFNNTMNQLIELTNKYGTELIPGNAKREMSMLVRDAQLQAKDIYNLGVLNGPDLSLMEAIISDPTEFGGKLNQLFGVSYKKNLEKAKAKIIDNAYSQASSIGLTPITGQTTTPLQQQPTTTKVTEKAKSITSKYGY